MLNNKNGIITFALIAFAVFIYFLSGIYSLQTGQQALIVRFGRILKVIDDPGIHYCFPIPFEKAIKMQTSKVQTISIQESQNDSLERFTGDENLLAVQATLSYDIKNLSDYISKTGDVKLLIQAAGQMCLTKELTSMTVDDAMTTGKSLLRLVIKEKLQKMLDEMEIGVRLISVELTDISPPKGVSDAFNAVSNARVKKQEIIKDAEGYANEVIPKARGDASSLISQAEAYSNESINKAEGNVFTFNELLKEYNKNPKNTINMKLFETMKTIFSRCKVTIDTEPSKSIYYITE